MMTLAAFWIGFAAFFVVAALALFTVAWFALAMSMKPITLKTNLLLLLAALAIAYLAASAIQTGGWLVGMVVS
jgi:hypothetical protein